MINAGELNKLLIIQKRTRSKNSFGEESNVFVNHLICWAKIRQTKSKTDNKEIFRNNQVKTRVNFEFLIRYNPTLTTDMRIIYGKHTFDILNIDNIDQSNVEMLILAEEVV